MQPLANTYRDTIVHNIQKYPLALNVCLNCWHSQLTYCVDRKFIFDSYTYISGTSNTLKNYFRWFAQELKKIIPLNGKVLEIAANDGSLIHEFDILGINAIGIDPAINIVNSAFNEGTKIVCGYWPKDSQKINGKFDAIICMNVLAHVENPYEFLLECRNKLTTDGFILIQPSQARMFGNYEFDTCYHEHISFFNTSSIRALCFKLGLKLLKTFLVSIHGDSPIYILINDGSELKISRNVFISEPFGMLESLEEYELNINLFKKSTYELFFSKSLSILDNLNLDITNFKSNGFDIIFVGAAAKAMTVINAIGIVPDYFIDEAPLKIGLYPAGIPTKIENFDLCKKLNKPALFVITAWNFKIEISEKLKKLNIAKGSVIYSYFPSKELICV
jgi:SAM-dependent methyltransferase